MIGQQLDGRYQVIRSLSGGGFGQTYLARDTRRPGNPICVVKHLKPATTDPKFLETARRLFHSEAETLEQLGNHDRIPRLLAFFEENQEFFLVQEFIEGHTLTAELPVGQRWSEAQVVAMLRSVLEILAFVHGQQVIHRDLKPDNLIRRQTDQQLVLVDFGAVKQMRTQMALDPGLASATVAIGTPGYMPTEQGQGKPRFNSDLYALGMIALQALTGLLPTQIPEDLNTGELLWQTLVTISPGLQEFLEKMTRYHFKDRYAHGAEALQALQQLCPWAFTTTSPAPYPPTVGSPAVSPPTPVATPIPAITPIPAATPLSVPPNPPPTTVQPLANRFPQPATPLSGSAVPAAQATVSPKKTPAIIPILIGCGGLVVAGVVGIVVLAIAIASLDQPNTARESEAQNYVGSLNRAQQAYRIDSPKFTDDWTTLGVDIPEATDNYVYEVEVLEPTLAAMHTAVAAQDDLHSYVGLVWLQGLDPLAVDSFTTTLVCQSDVPTTEAPAEPQIVETSNGSDLACPIGYSPLN